MTIQSELQRKIETRSAHVGIIGMGYVGLPLAARAGRLGFSVLGFDVVAELVAQLNKGESHIGDVPTEVLRELRDAQRFEATTDVRRLRSCDVVIVCVPTPLNATRDPDVSFIEHAA